MTQAESKAEVSAGVQQEQLEAEERRRSVVLLLLGLAAAILAFWLGVFRLVPGAAFPVSAAFEGVAGGNVVLVGYNGSQKFFCVGFAWLGCAVGCGFLQRGVQ
jgi:hypothetical protein